MNQIQPVGGQAALQQQIEAGASAADPAAWLIRHRLLPGRDSVTCALTIGQELGMNPSGGQMRVLVIDDDPGCTSGLTELLTAAGHAVEAVASGTAALAAAAHFAPHAALVDLGLPDIDGFELANLLAASESKPRLIAITGYRGASSAATEHAGFEACLLKPLDVPRLLKILASPPGGAT